MKICTAQLLCSDVFTGRGFDKRRSRQIDGAGALHDHVLIAHGWHIGPACRAHAHHHGNLRNAKCRHPGLVIEDAPKVLSVGKHFRLHRQEHSAGVHQVDRRQPVFEGDLLSAKVFLDGDRKIGAAFDGRIVGGNHAGSPRHIADAGDKTGGGELILVHAGCSEGTELQPGSMRVDQSGNPLAGRELASLFMKCDRFSGPACFSETQMLLKVGKEPFVMCAVRPEFVRCGDDRSRERSHVPLNASVRFPSRRPRSPA